MTTIVYDKRTKQIALDSRSTRGSQIVSDNTDKHKEIDGAHYFIAGSLCDFHSLYEMIQNPSAHAQGDVDSTCMVVRGESVTLYAVGSDGYVFADTLNNSEAIGSGSSWALASVDYNQGATKAVEYAKTRDIYTGGEVRTFDIELGVFL